MNVGIFHKLQASNLKKKNHLYCIYIFDPITTTTTTSLGQYNKYNNMNVTTKVYLNLHTNPLIVCNV